LIAVIFLLQLIAQFALKYFFCSISGGLMLAFSFRHFVIAIVLPVFAVAGCAKVPSFDSPLDAPVSGKPEILVVDVVKRTKYELYLALCPHLPPRNDPKKFKWAPNSPNKNMFVKDDPNSWLASWVATAHMELVLNDQGSLTPGLTITQPLVNSYNVIGGASSIPLGKPPATYSPSVSGSPQFFSVGVGGGVSTQAARADDVQFSVSVNELVGEFEYNPKTRLDFRGKCEPTDAGKYYKVEEGEFLKSNLGLDRWIDSALGPAMCHKDPLNPLSEEIPCKKDTADADENDFRYLRLGYHPAVTSTGVALKQISAPAPPPRGALAFSVSDTIRGMLKQPGAKITNDKFTQLVDEYESKLAGIQKSITDIQQNYDKVIRPVYRDKQGNECDGPTKKIRDEYYTQGVADYRDILTKAQQARQIADPRKGNPDYTAAAKFLLDAIDGIDAITKQLPTLNRLGQEFQFYMTAGQCKPVQAAKQQTPPDPPVDNISHTVQFLVASSVNATPSWSFARIKANTSGSLAALTHNNTQTLIVVLGPSTGSKGTMNAGVVGNEDIKNSLRLLQGLTTP
jgi:hypothetical protein